MYHPGRVVEIFESKNKNITAADKGTQAMLEMWDDNVITVSVDSNLPAIKKGDVVLVDYTGQKLVVIKILKGDIAKSTWIRYREQHRKKKQDALAVQQAKNLQIQQHDSYVG
jgi:hypothetical protein